MSATAAKGRRRGHEEEHEEHENEERWLVSFADMMTLLFCLFMVLFAISSVNTSKLEALSKSLQESISGKVLSGGQAVMESGSTNETDPASPTPPIESISPAAAVAQAIQAPQRQARADAAQREQETFVELKRRIDADAKSLGLEEKVRTEVRERGLVVRLLTDGVFFDSGSANLKVGALPVLTRLGGILREEARHPIVVEGYTDDQPIQSAQFPSNWELSGARASGVVRQLLVEDVALGRLSTAGYAAQHPVSSNATPEGRSQNRRVEIVLTRLNQTPAQGGAAP